MKIDENTNILNIYWDDKDVKPRPIGVLAQDKDDYYIAFNKRIIVKTENGKEYKIIPGFNPNEIYKSNQMFDFVKRRLGNKNSNTPLIELTDTQGRSMVDSVYFLNNISSRRKPIRLSALKRAYEVQEKIKKVKKSQNDIEI